MVQTLEGDDEAKGTNLFESAGTKQTAKDFKPAPDRIQTDFGTLRFAGGALPTEESADLIYDELDLQRATQAYLDLFPALSLYGIVKAQIRGRSSSEVCEGSSKKAKAGRLRRSLKSTPNRVGFCTWACTFIILLA